MSIKLVDYLQKSRIKKVFVDNGCRLTSEACEPPASGARVAQKKACGACRLRPRETPGGAVFDAQGKML